MKPLFGNIGVCIEDYSKESLFDLLVEHELDDLIDERSIAESKPFTSKTYLQSECTGPFRVGTTIDVNVGFVNYVIDMENFLLILRVGILDPDIANNLIEELYSQELIKPRSES